MDQQIPYGRVILDDTPVEIPTRLKMPQSRSDQIRDFIRHELSLQAASQGKETFEEADDFDIDESEPLTRYELMMLDGEIQPLVERIKAHRAQLAAAAVAHSPPVDSAGVAGKTAASSAAESDEARDA